MQLSGQRRSTVQALMWGLRSTVTSKEVKELRGQGVGREVTKNNKHNNRKTSEPRAEMVLNVRG